jgi:hypothetical protein
VNESGESGNDSENESSSQAYIGPLPEKDLSNTEAAKDKALPIDSLFKFLRIENSGNNKNYVYRCLTCEKSGKAGSPNV